ncbi:MAG: GNAT family N-acetyltransferase [Clostridia bacterium]|nr:GNAT family N-acetyltransferase [Clostridia bacterium]
MVTLTPVPLSQRETLRNLMEKYLYEFSQYDLNDLDENGLYNYQYLDCYWQEPNRFPYFIRTDGKLAGFVLVNDYPEVPDATTDFTLSEFFVLHKYRRSGVGREAARLTFSLHHGRWQLKRHPHNIASVHFWNRVIADYTGGDYQLIERYPNREVDYSDGTPADVFFFSN